MSLSIIIPVFNEVKLLPQILRKVIQATPLIDKEIIIVDDCSNDGTEKWLTEIRKKKYNYINVKKNKLFFKKNKTLMNLRIILKNKNEGKGSAVIIGLKHSKKKIIVIQDADLEYNPNDLNIMIKQIEQNNIDIVFGDRFAKKTNKYHYLFYAFGNFFLSKWISILFKKKICDVAACYKMFKNDVIKNLNLNSKDFMLDFELPAKILKKNKFKFINIPISYKGRKFSEGKKITWKDGMKAMFLIFKIKLFY